MREIRLSFLGILRIVLILVSKNSKPSLAEVSI